MLRHKTSCSCTHVLTKSVEFIDLILLTRHSPFPHFQSQTIAARQQVVHPRLTWQYHNYTSMTTFLRHVSTIYSNLTALYSIGQSVQVGFRQ